MTEEKILDIDGLTGSDRRNSSWDIQNAPRNYVSLVLAQGGSAFFAFASVWLLTRSLGSEGYGGVVAVIAASQMVQVLVNWTNTAVVRFGVEEFVETGKIARTFWLRFFILVPNLVLVVLAAKLWFPLLSDLFKLSTEVLWLILIHLIASTLWLHVQSALQAVKMPRLQGGLLMVERALIFLSLLVIVFTGGMTPVSAMLSYAVIPFVVALVGSAFLRKFIWTGFSFAWDFWREVLVFSLPLLPFTITAYLSTGYLDAAFIIKYLSTRELGIYAVATQVNGLSLQLPTLANSLLLPLFVSLQKEEQIARMQRYFRHTFPTLILLWGIFVTFAALAGWFLIPAVFGKEFAYSTQPLWILLTTSVLALPFLLGYGSLSNATSTTYISMWTTALAALANIAFNFLLIPVLGMQGCAWATSIMYLTNSVAYIILLRRVIDIPVSWTFLAAIPSVGGAIALSLSGNPWWAAAVCLITTFFVAYRFNASIRDTVNFLRNFGKY
ncbi:MAG TPA: oligosaccharide flippase family protein [Pyrinomonadaceae bacterium]|nr:oligosaccharide flippase family protein [Pyrinomonadaceae bacterium]